LAAVVLEVLEIMVEALMVATHHLTALHQQVVVVV
jgi:hypothetical protein